MNTENCQLDVACLGDDSKSATIDWLPCTFDTTYIMLAPD